MGNTASTVRNPRLLKLCFVLVDRVSEKQMCASVVLGKRNIIGQ